jgi:excisionase family DNA binding protein
MARLSAFVEYRRGAVFSTRKIYTEIMRYKKKGINMAAELAELEKRLFSVENIMQMLGIGRTKVYQEMDSGRLRSVKVGRRRLVSAAALEEFINQLESGAGA